jgi:hypothetical protein
MLIVSIIIGCAIAIALLNKVNLPSKSRVVPRKSSKSRAASSAPPKKSLLPFSPSILKNIEIPTPETVPLKLSIPRPPVQQNKVVEAKCEKTGEKLKTNLYEMTCSCKEFGENHVAYPIGDIRRLCKHLNNAYRAAMNLDDLDLFKKAIIGRGHAVKSHFLYLHDKNEPSSAETVLFLFDKEYPWWDVFVNSDNDIQCYGFNILSNSWSHNQTPTVIGDDLVRAIENIIVSGEFKISDDMLKVREIVSKVSTKQHLMNLQRRLERAERRYTADSTPAQDKKYELLCMACEVAENKIFWQEQNELGED